MMDQRVKFAALGLYSKAYRSSSDTPYGGNTSLGTMAGYIEWLVG